MTERDLLPGSEKLRQRLRRLFRERTFEKHSLVFARFGGDTVAFWRGAPVSVAQAAVIAKRSHVAVAVMAPEDLVFAQFVEVPVRVLDDVREMLPLHLKRWSPFPPDMMVAAANVVGRGSSIGTVEVRYCSPDAVLELFRAQLSGGVAADAIVIGNHPRWMVELRENVFRFHVVRRLSEVALAALAIIMSVAVVDRAFSSLDALRARIDKQTVEMSRAVLETQKIESRITTLKGTRRTLVETPVHPKPVSRLLSSVGGMIPPSGRLVAIDYEEAGSLTITIQTPRAETPKATLEFEGWQFVDSGTTILSGGSAGDGAEANILTTTRFKRLPP